jgi:hypothetical protein
MQLKLFFSHAWADKESGTLKFLQNRLKASYDSWIDKKEIGIGENIPRKIEEGITECDVYLIAWSKAAAISEAVQSELTIARKMDKPMIVCVIDGHSTAESPLLREYKYVSFNGDPLSDEAEWNRLNNALMKRVAGRMTDSPEITTLKKELNQLEDIQVELEDLLYRYRKEVSGNDASNEYIQGALHEFVKLFGSEEDEKMRLFAEAAQAISVRYPLGKDDARKQRLLLQAVLSIDPEQTEPELQELRVFIEQQVALDAEETREPPAARQRETPPPVGTTDSGLVREAYARLAGRKLLAMQSSSSGSGDSYSSSSDVVHLQLFADGTCHFMLVRSNYANHLGMMQDANEQDGTWQLYDQNGQLMVHFQWNNGTVEDLKITLEQTNDALLNGVKYGIVDLNYEA